MKGKSSDNAGFMQVKVRETVKTIKLVPGDDLHKKYENNNNN